MNNINRNNYETFFLLYTDNELSAAEKKMVDDFVQKNPDLQEELLMLHQSILKPADIVFEDKMSLLKNEFISTPVHEKLLLHLDNELTAAERNEMDLLIKTDAGINKEWVILQQTKLLPGNAIVFEDKQSLYRKENGRVIAIPWRRMAAAAVFIGFCLWGGSVYLNKGTKVADKAVAKSSQPTTNRDTVKPFIPQSTEQIANTATGVNKKEIAQTPVAIKKSPAATRPSPVKVEGHKLPGNEPEIADIKQASNNLPKPYFENVNNTSRNKTNMANVTIEKQSIAVAHPANNDIVKSTVNPNIANVYASTTSYADNSEENSNRILFMNEEKIKKTKLGGIFKKVKRVLERSANLKPGDNNIKVANLEFAIQ